MGRTRSSSSSSGSGTCALSLSLALASPPWQSTQESSCHGCMSSIPTWHARQPFEPSPSGAGWVAIAGGSWPTPPSW